MKTYFKDGKPDILADPKLSDVTGKVSFDFLRSRYLKSN